MATIFARKQATESVVILKNIPEWRDGAIGAALAIGLGWLLLTPLGDGLANLSYELPFVFRPNIHVEDAVILYMDDDSHLYLHQPIHQGWDRSVHARTLDRLKEWGARAVVFDVLFEESTMPEQDNALVQAVQRHGNVIVAGSIEPQIEGGAVIGARERRPFTNVFRCGIAETPGPDRFVRQHYRDNAFHSPSLAHVVAQATMPTPPSDPSEARWINYYGPPGIVPFFSYYRVLSNAIPVEQISKKVVFIGEKFGVGFTGGLGTDDFRTPYTRWTGNKSPGTEIVATAYLNLLRRDWLTELPGIYELLLVVGCGALLGFGLVRCQPMRAAAIGAVSALLLSGGAILLTWQSLVWFPWLIPVAVQVPAAVCWSVLGQTRRLRQQKQALEVQLAAAQVAAHSAETAVDQRPTISVVPAEQAPPPIPDHTLVRPIGQGAYGEVWLARDIIGSFHAVKVVYRNKFKDSSPFEREFRGIQKFTPISRSHPGFVNVLHVGRNDEQGYFYYIMELGDDQTGGQKIDPARYSPKNLSNQLRRSGRLPPEECLQIALNLCSALHHLHQHQLIHRDIKPANIIFVNGVPKFADIGLVTEMRGAGRDVTFVGTEGYIAPEGPGSAAADVYSLGRVLYEISTGLDHARFPELPTVLMADTLDTQFVLRLNKVVLKACENEVGKRFQSAAEMHAELERLLTAVPKAGWDP